MISKNSPEELFILSPMQQQGFTLIELLMVIAIIAVLAIVVVLVLNPADLLRQSRDANRISDLSSINRALIFYLADGQMLPGKGCYAHASSTAAVCGQSTTSTGMGFGTPSSTSLVNLSTSSTRATDGTGWLPINFSSLPSGSPYFGVLPLDPINNSSCFYAFAVGCSSTYKLNSRMESAKYLASGTFDVVTEDGGTSGSIYEVGNDLAL